MLNLKINLTRMNSATGNSPLRKKLEKSKIIDLCGKFQTENGLSIVNKLRKNELRPTH